VAFGHPIKSIAIGAFDGIHLGHKSLLERVDAAVIIERNSGYLTPGYKRALYTDKICCFYHFDTIKGLTPLEFVVKLQTDFPALERIVVGYDFHFAKDKAGNAELLRTLCDKEIIIVKQVTFEQIPVHSRTIKDFLKEGNIKMANKLLGRAYVVEGEVVRGQGLGKKELVPTINLRIEAYQLPLEGVYATRTCINGTWFDSVSFLGQRVTTDDSFAVETHLLDTDIAEVRGVVVLEFIAYIRCNKRFETLEALKNQIQEDIAQTKRILLQMDNLC
jgi:riboflavin kinase/FMN adenylyltransferase